MRFFLDPGESDRNGDPFPGILPETNVTQQFEDDLSLNSHAIVKDAAYLVDATTLNKAARSDT